MSSTDIQQPDVQRPAPVEPPLRFHHHAATVLVARIAAATLAVPFLATLVTGVRGGFALIALVLLFCGAWLAVHVHRRAAVRPEAVSVDQDGITLHGPGPAHRLAWNDVTALHHRRLRMTVSLGTRGDPDAMTFDADLDDFRGFLEAVTMHLGREVAAPEDPAAPAARGGDAQVTDARGQSLFRRSIGEDVVTFAASAAGIVLGLFAQPAYFLITLIALARLTWHWLTAPHSAVIDHTAVWIIRPLARDVIPLRAIRTATLGTAGLPVAAAIVIDHRDRGTLLIRGFGAATLPLFSALTAAMRRDRAALQNPAGVRRTGSSVQIAGMSRSVMLTTAAAMLGLIGIAWLTILTGVPLRTATIHGSELIARSVLLLGGRPGSADRDGFTALHHAAARNDAAIAAALIRGGSDANARSRPDGATPLHLAAGAGHHAVVELLVGAGADVDSRSTAGRTPLSYAAGGERGDTDVGRMLLNGGADPDAADDEGRTTVHHAAAAGHGPILQLLARAGANLETADAGGHRPLHAAVMTNRQASAAALVAAGADINGRGADGHTALGYAAARPDSPLPLINTLLDAGARADIAGDDGWNAVQRAARSNNLEMLQLLTRRRAPLNGASARVAPALWIAVENGHTGAARILLRGGASPYLRWDGRSAIDLARAKNYASLVALMQMR